MFTWGVIVFIGLWLILADVKPVAKAKLQVTVTKRDKSITFLSRCDSIRLAASKRFSVANLA